ncbi:hypothetical protein IE53DRAFT_205231 [Violaceomyces palustris]|uniref:Uncharacterized protein n=1 Tax=Violaceomyces palustris TaxID=1673888 RepID=A0ACD0NR14_9BASI|nr:hypothetical protein IE53DRAFT_205231 [Violaceomyces palustris]
MISINHGSLPLDQLGRCAPNRTHQHYGSFTSISNLRHAGLVRAQTRARSLKGVGGGGGGTSKKTLLLLLRSVGHPPLHPFLRLALSYLTQPTLPHAPKSNKVSRGYTQFQRVGHNSMLDGGEPNKPTIVLYVLYSTVHHTDGFVKPTALGMSFFFPQIKGVLPPQNPRPPLRPHRDDPFLLPFFVKIYHFCRRQGDSPFPPHAAQ